jgi:hypothetical protein
MTDLELMDKAWDYLAGYTVGERPNASDVNDLVFALESRLAQPETPDVTPEVNPYVINCPRCGHCCPQWFGLTDHDYETLSQYAFVEVIEKVEALLKEKNT